MEITTKELGAIEKVVSDKAELEMKELAELELALVGGGQGDVAFG